MIDRTKTRNLEFAPENDRQPTVRAMGRPGVGGAEQAYEIIYPDANGRPLHLPLDFISLTEPGVTNEALPAIVIDRLEGFQDGEFACFENAEALRLIQGGLRILNLRTTRRQQRGVEGKAEA